MTYHSFRQTIVRQKIDADKYAKKYLLFIADVLNQTAHVQVDRLYFYDASSNSKQ